MGNKVHGARIRSVGVTPPLLSLSLSHTHTIRTYTCNRLRGALSRTSPLRMARQEGRTARERVRTHIHMCDKEKEEEEAGEADMCKRQSGRRKEGIRRRRHAMVVAVCDDMKSRSRFRRAIIVGIPGGEEREHSLPDVREQQASSNCIRPTDRRVGPRWSVPRKFLGVWLAVGHLRTLRNKGYCGGAKRTLLPGEENRHGGR